MTDILLVQPPAFGAFCPPLGLATLSAYLRRNEVKVQIVDYNIRFYNQVKGDLFHAWNFSKSHHYWIDYPTYTAQVRPYFKKFSREIVRDILMFKTDLVGISVLQTSVFSTIDLIETIHEFFGADVKIVLGGPSMTVTEAPRFLREHGALAVFQGEAELGLTDLIQRKKHAENSRGGVPLSFAKIAGAIYEDRGVVVVNDKDSVRDLDSLPYPDFTDFDLDSYGFRERVVPIATSRGCVARCRFCSEMRFMEKYRERSASRIVDEIQHHIETYGVRVFRFNDSLINGNLKNLEAWLDELIARNIKITFGAVQARINIRMSDQLLEKLRKAGCQLISYGVETGSDRMLKIMRKGITSKDAYQVIQRTNSAGIAIQVNIIVGHFEETILDYLKTLLFVFRIRKFTQFISLNCYGFTEYSDDYQMAPDIVNKTSERWRTRSGWNNYLIRRFKRSIVIGMMKMFRIREP